MWWCKKEETERERVRRGKYLGTYVRVEKQLAEHEVHQAVGSLYRVNTATTQRKVMSPAGFTEQTV